MKEIIQDKKNWVQIKGMPYYISKQGQVYSVTSKRVLKPILSKKGYYIVSFKIKGHRQRFFLHRIIAEAFIPNPENKPFIDHINTIKTDNRIENLRWVTAKENTHNPITILRIRANTKYGEDNPRTMTGKFGRLNPRSRPIVQIKDGKIVREFECARQAMRETSIDCCSITNCCRGKRKRAGGYHWAYKEYTYEDL